MSNSTKSLYDKFEIVTSESDRLAVFRDFERSKPAIAAVAKDEATFMFQIKQLENSLMVLNLVDKPRKIVASENIFLIFSVSSGQYMMTGAIREGRDGTFVFNYNVELRRLQRRRNFRISTINMVSLKVRILSFGDEQKANLFSATDISAAGISVLIPGQHLPAGQVGQKFIFELIHPSRTIDDLTAVIRHREDTPNGQRWGVEFTSLSSEQAQSLLALSLQMHRESSSKMLV